MSQHVAQGAGEQLGFGDGWEVSADWVTGTITTSLLPYWAYRHGSDPALPADDPSPVPTAVSIFGGERVSFPKPPRELAQRYYTLTAWAEHPRMRPLARRRSERSERDLPAAPLTPTTSCVKGHATLRDL